MTTSSSARTRAVSRSFVAEVFDDLTFGGEAVADTDWVVELQIL